MNELDRPKIFADLIDLQSVALRHMEPHDETGTGRQPSNLSTAACACLRVETLQRHTCFMKKKSPVLP